MSPSIPLCLVLPGISDSLSCVVFHHLSFPISLFISQQLTVLFMCLSVLLNQSLSILSNGNTLLSLDGYPPSDCWKMKHGSFSYLTDLLAKKFFFSVVNMFLAALLSDIICSITGRGAEGDKCVPVQGSQGIFQLTNSVNIGHFSYTAGKQP